MEANEERNREPGVIRVELRYCPRCGALSIGTATQRVCAQCVDALHWLYAKAASARRRVSGGQP